MLVVNALEASHVTVFCSLCCILMRRQAISSGCDTMVQFGSYLHAALYKIRYTRHTPSSPTRYPFQVSSRPERSYVVPSYTRRLVEDPCMGNIIDAVEENARSPLEMDNTIFSLYPDRNILYYCKPTIDPSQCTYIKDQDTRVISSLLSLITTQLSSTTNKDISQRP